MIRSGACVMLATLSCLLALATSGAAECAWVLWVSYGDGRYEMVGASNTRESVCRADALGLERAALQRGETKIASFVCLPDTVDPRAPSRSR
jgi:hypothetical protein